jgi:hypothetical protein
MECLSVIVEHRLGNPGLLGEGGGIPYFSVILSEIKIVYGLSTNGKQLKTATDLISLKSA